MRREAGRQRFQHGQEREGGQRPSIQSPIGDQEGNDRIDRQKCVRHRGAVLRRAARRQLRDAALPLRSTPLLSSPKWTEGGERIRRIDGGRRCGSSPNIWPPRNGTNYELRNGGRKRFSNLCRGVTGRNAGRRGEREGNERWARVPSLRKDRTKENDWAFLSCRRCKYEFIESTAIWVRFQCFNTSLTCN